MAGPNAAYAELKRELGRVGPSSRSAFELLGTHLASALQSERFALYDVDLVEQGYRLGSYAGNAFPDSVYRQYFDAGAQAPKSLDRVLYDPLRPDPKQRNRALTTEMLLHVTERTTKASLYTEIAPRYGVADYDQLRVLVCDGPTLLAYVGVMRDVPYGAQETRLMQQLVKPLQARLSDESALRHSAALNQSFVVALEALGAEAWLVRLHRQDGFRLVHANAAGQATYEAAPAETAELIGTLLRGGAVPNATCTRIDAVGAPQHALITRRHRGERSSLVSHAAARWNLTRRQTQILRLLCRGHSNKAIAAELGCAEGTVELHLTHLYARMEVKSRSEALALILTLAEE